MFCSLQQALQSNINTTNPISKQQLSLGSGASIHALQKKHGLLKADKIVGSGSSSNPASTMAHGRTEDKLEEPKTILWSAENVVLGWRKKFPAGAGMMNLGNTCYMNSSLQVSLAFKYKGVAPPYTRTLFRYPFYLLVFLLIGFLIFLECFQQ